jgi:hypothetical protein
MDEKKASQFVLRSVMSSNRLAATHTLVISSNLVHNMLGTKKGEKTNQIKWARREREREKESVPKASKNNNITFVVVVGK